MSQDISTWKGLFLFASTIVEAGILALKRSTIARPILLPAPVTTATPVVQPTVRRHDSLSEGSERSQNRPPMRGDLRPDAARARSRSCRDAAVGDFPSSPAPRGWRCRDRARVRGCAVSLSSRQEAALEVEVEALDRALGARPARPAQAQPEPATLGESSIPGMPPMQARTVEVTLEVEATHVSSPTPLHDSDSEKLSQIVADARPGTSSAPTNRPIPRLRHPERTRSVPDPIGTIAGNVRAVFRARGSRGSRRCARRGRPRRCSGCRSAGARATRRGRPRP
jgi:hypothetical protein